MHIFCIYGSNVMIKLRSIYRFTSIVITLTSFLIIAGCEGSTTSIPEDSVSTTSHNTGVNTGGGNTEGGDTGGDNAGGGDTGGGNAGGGDTGGDNAGGGDTGGNNVGGGTGGNNIGTGGLAIQNMGMVEVPFGSTFVYTPTITGDVSLCRKDLGHDDVIVDPETGKITWNTNNLTYGRGFYIRIKCSNFDGEVYASMIVHVDRSGTSRLRIAGENGVSPYIGVAGRSMNSGDTIVFPDGVYPVSVTRDSSYENAFKEGNANQPVDGSNTQFSTLMARTPGGVVISGAAQNGIPKQKNAIQITSANNLALAGFVIKDVLRESLAVALSSNSRILVDFVGAAGAGTNNVSCTNFLESGNGWCSMAGMRIGGGQPVFQNSYDWGHNRYGIMTRDTTGSITRRSFVRLDEHRGDQPYGGFSNYCDSAHRSQDNTVFDSLAITAPHYKNYAGLEAYPATGCQNDSANLYTEGLLAINNKLSLSLMDQRAGPVHQWDYIVSYDNEGTFTPHVSGETPGTAPEAPHGNTANWLLQAKKATSVSNSVFGKSRGYEGGTNGSAFDTGNVTLEGSVVLFDIPGVTAQNSPPRYLPESLLYYRGKSGTFFGDAGYNQVTTTRRYPIPGEDIMSLNMRSFSNPNALIVGGGTMAISGNRGATAQGESMSEYFWGYIDDLVPPLAVRAKIKGSVHRVAWERLTGSRRNLVTGWKVICVSNNNTELASLSANQLVYTDATQCADYGVRAVYAAGESGIAYIETAQLYN